MMKDEKLLQQGRQARFYIGEKNKVFIELT